MNLLFLAHCLRNKYIMGCLLIVVNNLMKSVHFKNSVFYNVIHLIISIIKLVTVEIVLSTSHVYSNSNIRWTYLYSITVIVITAYPKIESGLSSHSVDSLFLLRSQTLLSWFWLLKLTRLEPVAGKVLFKDPGNSVDVIYLPQRAWRIRLSLSLVRYAMYACLSL